MADVVIPPGALSAEQYQTLAQMGLEPRGPAPAQAFIESMPGAAPVDILRAASATPSLASAVAERLGLQGGSYTFGNPNRHSLSEALLMGAFEVLGGFGSFHPSSSPRQLTQLPGGDPQVNFPRPGSPIYVPGTAPPPGNTMPVPYEPPVINNPGPFAFGIGGIGAILTGVIAGMWEGWPNELGTETGPYPTRAPAGAPQDPSNAPPNPDLGPVPPGDYGPPSPADAPLEGLPPYSPPAPYDFGDAHDRAKKAMEDQLIKDMTGPAPPPAPAPAPTTQRRMPPWVWPAIGALGAIQLGRVGRSRSSQTVPAVPVTVGLDLGTLEDALASSLTGASSTSSSTYFLTQAGGAGAYDYGDDGCNCGPKKRGKKRKCLAWGQLSWRSGPKKGKAAGRRCVRFAPD